MGEKAGESDKFSEQLRQLFRVPWPLIGLRGAEEGAALGAIVRLTQSAQQGCWWWSATSGLVALSERVPMGKPVWSAARGHEANQQTHSDNAMRDVLEKIALHEAPGVFALLDVEPWLGDVWVQRALKELQGELIRRRQVVALCGPILKIPESLRRTIAVLDVPLPDRTALRAVLDQLVPEEQFRVIPRERMVAAALGLTRTEAQRAFQRARIVHETAQNPLTFAWDSHILSDKRRIVSQGDAVEFVDSHEGLSAVGGLDELKGWLDTRREAFGEEARRYGLPAPKGLLLVGVQGCGKSLAAKAVAQHWGLPLLRLDLGRIFSSHLPPDAALSQALMTASALAPSVLWVDEIEKGFGPQADTHTQRVLGSLLTWLQEKQSEVFFVATANEVDQLPPELLRKGRFDELFFVDLPDVAARAQIVSIHLKKRQRNPADFNLKEVAEATEHWSGAELEQLVIAGLYEAFAEARPLQQGDLLSSADQIVPLYRTREEAIKKLREWARSRARFAAQDRTILGFFGGP